MNDNGYNAVGHQSPYGGGTSYDGNGYPGYKENEYYYEVVEESESSSSESSSESEEKSNLKLLQFEINKNSFIIVI